MITLKYILYCKISKKCSNTFFFIKYIIFSVLSFGIKATQGVGGFLAGFGLEFIGFPENAEVGNLAQETITGLLFLNGPAYLMIYLLAVLFMTLYALDKQSHGEILEQLEARRKGS